MEDVGGTGDGREAVRCLCQLRIEKCEKPALERGDVVRLWRATAVTAPQPAGDTAVGDVRRVRPVDGARVEVERLRDGAEIALVVNRIGCGQRAIDIENREPIRNCDSGVCITPRSNRGEGSSGRKGTCPSRAPSRLAIASAHDYGNGLAASGVASGLGSRTFGACP